MGNKDKWSALSMKERADLIKLYVSNGVTSLNDIKKDYNSFAPGGPIETDEYGYPADITPAVVEADYPREAEVWKRADTSNADMIQRLKQGSSRETIPDWEYPEKVATHKMMSAGNYVIGNVQNINGKLIDFTDPKYGFKDSDRAAIDSAIERGDYVKFDTEGDARYFAEHYKKHYNSFGDGGDKSKIITTEMTPSQAIKYNESADNAAFMIPYGGTPDNPEFLYPEELEEAAVIASAKEAKQKALEKEVAKLNSSDAWKTIPIRQGENFEANKHAREYVEDLNNAAIVGIGGTLLATNPFTTELAIDALNGTGHATHVMLDPLAANTMFGAFLGTASQAAGITAGIYNASNTIDKWINGNFNWYDIPYFVLDATSAIPVINTMYGLADDAVQMVNNAYKTQRAARNATKSIAHGDPGLAQDYINSVGNAMEPVQVDPNVAKIYNQQISGKLASQNTSKLTPEELSGAPKGVRNNVRSKQSIEGANRLKKFHDSNVSINSETVNNSSFPDVVLKARQVKSGIPIDKVLDQQIINMKKFASTLNTIDDSFKSYKLNNGTEMENLVVTEFRKYLSSLGYPATDLSTDEIAKILTYNRTHLQNNLTGELKDKILWHTTSKFFDSFDWKKHVGSTTNNTGLYGSGNYFSLNAPAEYGQDPIHIPMVINNVEQIIPRNVKLDMSKINPLPHNSVGIGSNTGSTQNFFRMASGLSVNQYSSNIPEVVISRDSGIKSLFPHPDRFIMNSDGTISFIPVDWNDPRFNFKNGGKLLTKRK